MENLFSKAKNCFEAKKKVSRKKQPGKLLIDNNRKNCLILKNPNSPSKKKIASRLCNHLDTHGVTHLRRTGINSLVI